MPLSARRPWSRRLAAPLVAGLALVGCVACTGGGSEPPPSPAPAPSGGWTRDAYYAQQLDWTACGDFQCATMAAPLDWAAADGGAAIDIAVKKAPARGTRIGSLVINPGGPGASGVDLVDQAVTSFGKRVLAAYDVVGFDPRGVGGSSAVSCGGDATVDAYFTADLVVEDQAGLDAARQQVAALGAACQQGTGDLLGHVDTASAARDLDLLRAVLGDEQLTYLGFSYGTMLGARYADLFPERVGRVVLDGAMDPALDVADVSAGQAAGFEQALRAYVADCQASRDCPLQGGVDAGLARIKRLVDDAARAPLPTSGGDPPLNRTLAFDGISAALYDQGSWPYLTQGLREAIQDGDGSTLAALADAYLDRSEDGRYTSNTMVAFTAINCLDYPAETLSFDELQARADRVAEQAPTFAELFTLTPGCETWPVASVSAPAAVRAAGAAPIVVIGTTRDPATPYAWAQSLAEQLESGVLLTYDGDGHTAYGRSNACVGDAVDAYLVDGTVPAAGTRC